MPRSTRLNLLIAFLCVVSLALVGCRAWSSRLDNLRGMGYDEQTNELTKNLRGPSDERQMTGFDARARDIERNLGVR